MEQPSRQVRKGRAAGKVSQTSGLQTAILVIVSIAMLAGALLVVYFNFQGKKSPHSGNSDTTEIQDRNIAFDHPGPPWMTDNEMVAKLGSPVFIVYKRSNPDAFMAFGIKDFETRSPRPSEIRDGLNRPLTKYFEDIRTTDLPEASWLGKKALAYEFRARMKKDGTTVAGECYAISYQGIAYWSICWAGESDTAAQLSAFAATRDRFKLLGFREKWQPRESPVRPFGGHRLGYQLLDAEGIWAEADPKQQKPDELDPNGDLLLLGTIKRRGADTAAEATILVSIIESKGGDPLVQARQYLQDFRKNELKSAPGDLTPEFLERTGEIEGDPTANTVEQTAPILRLDGTVPGVKSQSRLYVISAIKSGDKLVMAIGWCIASEKAIFETKLSQIVGSLRESK